MSEKRRARKRKDEYTEPGEQKVEKPSKDEYNVAKWLKKNVKTKKTKFLNHNVEYFTSSKAIDALMKSKFVEGNSRLFTTREQIIDFLDIMLEHKFYHRAKKVPVTLDEIRTGKSDGAEKTTTTTSAAASSSTTATTTTTSTSSSSSSTTTTATSSTKKTKEQSEQKKSTKSNAKDTEAEAEASGGNGDGNGNAGDKKEKKKRKIRLDMHPEQVFVDGSEAYVWIYDPIPLHYWIFGFILLLGAVGICLFPLWPPMLRQGVYYLSMLAAGFLVFILALTVVRLIIFTIVWALTGGKLNFWIFPNLTEDVGFFASFWPLYESKYVDDDEDKAKTDQKKSKTKSKKKDKDSDAEDDNNIDADADNDADDADLEAIPLEPEKIEEIKEHDADIELRRRKVNPDTEDDSQQSGDNSEDAQLLGDSHAKIGTQRNSESDSDGSSKDYEIISSSEVQNVN